MMYWGMMFGDIVAIVFFSGCPVVSELALIFSVSEPMVLHIHCLELFHDIVVDNAKGKYACLRESVHALLNFDMDISIGVDLVSELVQLDKFRWEILELHAHVFGTCHWRHGVEVFEIYCAVACAFGGDDRCSFTVTYQLLAFHNCLGS